MFRHCKFAIISATTAPLYFLTLFSRVIIKGAGALPSIAFTLALWLLLFISLLFTYVIYTYSMVHRELSLVYLRYYFHFTFFNSYWQLSGKFHLLPRRLGVKLSRPTYVKLTILLDSMDWSIFYFGKTFPLVIDSRPQTPSSYFVCHHRPPPSQFPKSQGLNSFKEFLNPNRPISFAVYHSYFSMCWFLAYTPLLLKS